MNPASEQRFLLFRSLMKTNQDLARSTEFFDFNGAEVKKWKRY